MFSSLQERDDPEIEELRIKLRQKGISFLTPYPNEENFIVQYVQVEEKRIANRRYFQS